MTLNPQMIWIAAAVIAALVIILAVSAGVRRARSRRLQEHFGNEYKHTVEATGSRTRAEEELAARAEEAKTYDIRPLTAVERERYQGEWAAIERRFVDRPTTAVVEADELVRNLMTTRGYPMADFEKHAALLSVKHPRIVEHFRAGHRVIDEQGRGAASTEDLRQGMLHYRALFDELVNDGDVAREIAPQREVIADRDRPRAFESPEIRDIDDRRSH